MRTLPAGRRVAVERLFGAHAVILRDRALHWLFAANAFIVLGIAMVSPILETLQAPFGVSAAEIGLFVTAIALPAIFLIPVSGVLTDRVGRKPLLVAGLLLFGVGGSAVAIVADFRIALGFRFMQGVGVSAALPPIVSSIRDLYPDSQEATAQGFRVAVTGVSQAIFSASAGFLVVLAWQFPFLLYGLAIPVAVGIAIWFEEPLEPGDGDGEVPDDLTGYFRDVLEVTTYPRVAALLIAHAMNFFALFTFFTYNSLVIVGVAGGGAREAGLIVGTFSLLYAGIATQVGRITDRFDSRTKPLLAAHASNAVGLGVFALAPHPILSAVGALILAAGMGVTTPMYRSLISGFGRQEIRGGMVSAGESMGWVSVTIAPVLIGLTISGLTPVLGETAALQLALVTVGGVTSGICLAAVYVAGSARRTEAELALG